ncbi:MAG: TRAP transporter large permease [Hydrogenophaga sp.]|jgi:C4-dicarboxylate transporter, DctM subunit|uniref:TRAP transporter large permease n=1 Tax=Hydrogenophaga sp. TaxID=1904254 RepID=UPI0026051A16|nr:TRAP transporter large permease [Hydrogenophaga sp.]MCV0440567.1 TRAP transporter large permease [Hydrogenophaga sp.]
MLALTLFGVFFAIALAGVPLLFSILATTVGIIWWQDLGHPLESILLSFVGGVEPFILLAVPLFIFAGELLAHGGVGQRIVAFARVLFGWMPGGLGVVTVMSCTMFGGVSGSAIADTAAIGSLVIPAMIARGYSRGFAAALLAVAGTIALLMPLSIPFLVYAFISGVSMRSLSMAGLLPALATAIALIVVCIWHGKRTGCDNGEDRSSAAEIWAATRAAGPALLMPVIIIGGIWTGFFTPSESAAIAVFYGLAISLFYYGDLSWRQIPQLLLNAFMTSATVMLVIGATGAMAWLITIEQVAVQMAEWIQLVATEPWMFLMLFNICLLLLGIFIEPLPAMLLCAPLFLPLARHFEMDMVHIGVVMTANLAIALYTPPVGGTLFVAAKLARAGIGEITRHLWPLMVATFAVVILITYMPSLSTWLPRFILSL